MTLNRKAGRAILEGFGSVLPLEGFGRMLAVGAYGVFIGIVGPVMKVLDLTNDSRRGVLRGLELANRTMFHL